MSKRKKGSMSDTIHKRVGQEALLQRGKLRFGVVIVAEESAYGRPLFTVVPINGTGRERVREDYLSMFKTPTSHD